MVLNRSLLNYRIFKHCTSGISPSEAMFGRVLRNQSDLLRNPIERVATQETISRIRKFCVNNHVVVKDYRNVNKEQWQNAKK